MRLRFALASSLVLIGKVAAQENVVNQTALAQLSPCVTQCGNQVLSKYACRSTDPCFCESKPLLDDLTGCIDSCPFIDQLAAIRFQASTCSRPARASGGIQALSYTLYGLATLFTIARVLSRICRLGGAGLCWDDYTVLISFIPLTIATACYGYAVDSGGGADIWGLNVQNVHDFIFWFYVFTLFYIPVLLLTKASLILLYLRIWPFESFFRSACRGTLILLFPTLAVFQIVAIFQCTPINFQWTRVKDPEREGTCINRDAWLWGLGSIVICVDLIVLLLPVPKLLKLDVPKSKKAGICAVFTVGLVVTAFSLKRMAYARGFSTTPNPTRLWGFVGMYSIVEAHLSQICCCVPTIPGLIRRTHGYMTGKLPNYLSSATSLQSSKTTNPATYGGASETQRDYTGKTFTLSRASICSAKSGAPAPVIHRQSHPPLPHHTNAGHRAPSVFMRDYRETGLFPGDDDRREQGLAMPPPAIPRR